jgi:hypothetical protein
VFRWRLSISGRDGSPQALWLRERCTHLIASAPPADILVVDPFAKPELARLEVRGDEIRVFDLTRVGLFLDGRGFQGSCTVLRSGTEVLVGSTRMRFIDAKPPEAKPG